MKGEKQGKHIFSRRNFFKKSALGSTSLFIPPSIFHSNTQIKADKLSLSPRIQSPVKSRWYLDLSPAKWIWYPAERTLTNTFFLFRKQLIVTKPVKQATGWILGESRYLLFCNGQRIQFGPAPADPRYTEADPLDLTKELQQGENIIAVQVMYYGWGDGTLPVGKYGLLFQLKLQFEDGSEEWVVSDDSWKVCLAKSWQPGQYKRWYLRALQEEFDARLHPYGWGGNQFTENEDWLTVKVIGEKANSPSLSTNADDYLYNASGDAAQTELRKRMIPLVKEEALPIKKLVELQSVKWQRSPEEYFDLLTENAFAKGEKQPKLLEIKQGEAWEVSTEIKEEGFVVTFELDEQVVGWPYFIIEASEGTTIELMVQEGHQTYSKGGPLIMNNHFHSWTRFICKAGFNRFETFDYESLRFLQLHIHRHNGKKIKLSEVGVRRRFYPWKKVPTIKTSDQNLQKLLQACINTVYNNSQETMVDGMGRERQQYSGDIGHQVHAIHPIFNAPEFFLRYLVTFSQGMTVDGFFLDTWPAYDRLNRLAQRQLGLTHWGPLLDHGIGFNFDCYYHFLYSGSLEGMEEVFPRLIRFFDYLRSLVTEENLLPVENIGIPTVWMDTDAYQLQRHKQCAFNLYAIAMLRAAFAPLCEQMGYKDIAKDAIAFSNTLHASTVKKFWDASTELFINNLPWIAEEEKKRMDDRTLATAYLYDLFPNGKSEKAVEAMANKVPEMGKSYPPNANWWLWAIAKAGKVEVILEDFSTRWIQMDSVLQNNTMQEAWKVKPDSRSQWSHAAIAPLYVTYMNLAGINPIEPGFEKYEIFPQLASLNTLELTYATVKGDIYFKVEGGKGKRRLTLKLPETGDGELVLPKLEKVKLPEISTNEKSGFRRYRLPKGETIQLSLKVV